MEANREQPYLTLNNGRKMPMIGLGTFTIETELVKPVVKAAIMEHGYRHIDTAKIYGNEE
jgi:diketogulonate reductase-like aldo/keto reductase